MQKIYVLLRNDQQTGPYSLQEIVQFDLKPYDLIWIEGKSAGWYYPQEIGDLRPYLRFLPQKPLVQNTTAPKTVFVSMPSVAAKEEPPAMVLPEKKVEAPIETYTFSAPATKNLEEEVFAQFRLPAEEKSSAFVSTTTQASPKKKPAISVGVGIAAILVVGGVFAASWIMNRHSGEEEMGPAETVAAAPVQEVAVSAPEANNEQPKASQPTGRAKQKQPQTVFSQRQTTSVAKKTAAPVQTSEKRTASSVSDMAVDEPTTTVVKEEPVIKQEEPTASSPEEAPAPQEKKKKLRDKILDIFRKKPDEQKTEEAQPTETTGGERRSTHRESGANLAQMVSVRFTVPNDWMMGIKGAKATLVNRSSQKVDKATVEVLYYNDDNELLQKKVISFSKVDGKESQTLSIPDHSTATRVDYNLVSVTGQPGA